MPILGTKNLTRLSVPSSTMHGMAIPTKTFGNSHTSPEDLFCSLSNMSLLPKKPSV
jgi:hypothetical protein